MMKADIAKLKDEGKVSDYQVFNANCRQVRPIAVGARIDLGGGGTLQAIHTPGHAAGHTCYLLTAPSTSPTPDPAAPGTAPGTVVALFPGDRVFTGGRISLQKPHDCRVPEYAAGLRRLARLRVNGRGIGTLLPGHHEISLARAHRHLTAAADIVARGLLPESTT